MYGSPCAGGRRWYRSRSLTTGRGNHRELQQRLFISVRKGDHLGLTGIADRVRGLGGAVWFERRRGGGVTLRVELSSQD